jgi:hypothetical protein
MNNLEKLEMNIFMLLVLSTDVLVPRPDLLNRVLNF